MGSTTCELIATIAALTTSNRVSGYRARRSTSNTRAKLTDGSGKPIAADSPRTNTRNVPGVFSVFSTTGTGNGVFSYPRGNTH